MWTSRKGAPSAASRGGNKSGGLQVLAPPDLPGVRLVQFQEATQVYSHYNEVYSIAALFRSGSDVMFRGRVHTVTPEDCIGLMEPDGVFRHIKIPIPETVGKLHISPAVFEDAARALGAPRATRFKTLLLRNWNLLRSLSELHCAIEADATTLEQQSRFSECLRVIIEQGTERAPAPLHVKVEHRAVRRAREMLHDRFAQRITLDELAAYTGLSSFHLVRVFTRQTGIPPHAYQNHLRLAHARQRLLQGASTLTTALEVGFADQSHLTRQFRRTLGLTPSAYVRGTYGGEPRSR